MKGYRKIGEGAFEGEPCGCSEELTEDKQRTLGLELIKLGIITQQDMGLKVRDVYYYNEFERK